MLLAISYKLMYIDRNAFFNVKHGIIFTKNPPKSFYFFEWNTYVIWIKLRFNFYIYILYADNTTKTNKKSLYSNDTFTYNVIQYKSK